MSDYDMCKRRTGFSKGEPVSFQTSIHNAVNEESNPKRFGKVSGFVPTTGELIIESKGEECFVKPIQTNKVKVDDET